MEIVTVSLLGAVLLLQIMLTMKLSPSGPKPRRRKSNRPAWEPKAGEKAAPTS